MDRLVEPKGSNGSEWSFLTKSSKEEIRLRFALTTFFRIFYNSYNEEKANSRVMLTRDEMPERLNSLMVERRNYISEARVRSAVQLFIFFRRIYTFNNRRCIKNEL